MSCKLKETDTLGNALNIIYKRRHQARPQRVILTVPNVNEQPSGSAQPRTADVLSELELAQILNPNFRSRLKAIHQIDGKSAQINPSSKQKNNFEILNLENVFHPQALMQLFQTINACIQIDTDQTHSTLSPYETELSNDEINKIYQRIAKIWEEKGFVNAKELLQELSSEFKSIDPEVFGSSLPPHPLTGLKSKFSAPIEIALAHAYAIKTQKPVSIIFGDIANVGGTNKFFRELLFSDLMRAAREGINQDMWTRLGISKEELAAVEELISTCNFKKEEPDRYKLEQASAVIREKAANTLTDWVTRTMMREIKAAFKEVMPEIYEQIKFNGLGGDEIAILVPEGTERTKSAIHKANKRITKLIKELGLNHHEHLKGKATGMGLTLLIRSLNDQELKLETVTEKEDLDLEKVNTRPPFKYDNVYDVQYSILNSILDRLTEDLNPSKTRAASVSLGKFDPNQQNDPNYLLRYQLYNVYNHDSGATDISALAASFDQNRHRALIAINLMNLAAINDNLSQELANKYQREFSEAISKIPEFADAELFSAGPGKLYLLLEKNIDADDINKQIKAIVDKFNSRSESKGEADYQIADLPNSENSKLKGLHYVMVNPGISADAPDINQVKEDAALMLKAKATEYLVETILRADRGHGSPRKPHVLINQSS